MPSLICLNLFGFGHLIELFNSVILFFMPTLNTLVGRRRLWVDLTLSLYCDKDNFAS